MGENWSKSYDRKGDLKEVVLLVFSKAEHCYTLKLVTLVKYPLESSNSVIQTRETFEKRVLPHNRMRAPI